MSHYLQWIVWGGITGVTRGAIDTLFLEHPFYIRVAGSLFWILFMMTNLSALWCLGRLNSRDWVDRLGIFIRGLGFLYLTLECLFYEQFYCLLFGLLAIAHFIFGRACWELFYHEVVNSRRKR